jgi:hypothetical protein
MRLILGSSYLADLEGNTGDSVSVIRKLIYEFTPHSYPRWILKVILGDNFVPLRFWCLFLTRMIILGSLKVKFFSIIYLIVLPLIANIKMRSFIAKLAGEKSTQFSTGLDRL